MKNIDSRICIGIVTKDRAALLSKVVQWTRKGCPNASIWICATKPSDIPVELDNMAGINVIFAGPSIPAQRNLIVYKTRELFDYILFIDDDTLISYDYLHRAVSFLDNNPDVVAFSGTLLRDGAGLDEGYRILLESVNNKVKNAEFFRNSGKHWVLYGCNMVMRSAIFDREKFDEAFAEYALYEDVEFSLRAVRHGRVGRYNGCLAVHLKINSGRFSSLRMTYADIINNHYILFRKRLIMSNNYAWCFCRFFLRVLFFNTLERFFRYILRGKYDEAGKVFIGFGFALSDIISGRAFPGRVSKLPE